MPSRRYDADRAQAGKRRRAISAAGREIGPLPRIRSRRRKDRCRLDLRAFCETYLAASFPLPWSADHLRVLARLEQVVLRGGQYALAMPRGSGKTTLCEAACIWALLYGHRRYVALIAADESSAAALLASIVAELSGNSLLLGDFPEVCYPLAALEGIAHRCRGQTLNGQRTQITLSARKLVLPTVRGSPASGSIAAAAGLTGRLRGMRHKTSTGRVLRPDLVLVDDPQTDASSRSVQQCDQRERLINGTILGLAGPGQSIAALVTCTVITPGDVADRLLCPERSPQWHGERCKLLYAMPARLDLWEEYADLRRTELASGGDGSQATQWYAQRQAAMDEGAIVAWPQRMLPGEISAVQHAMNLRIADPYTFACEYQNEPLAQQAGEHELPTAQQIATRLSRLPPGQAPAHAVHLVGAIDVQARILYWMLCAWSEDGRGAIVDYGAWPPQRRTYWRYSEIRHDLALATGHSTRDQAIAAGIERLMGELAARRILRADGTELALGRVLIDASWGLVTDLIYDLVQRSPHRAILLPAHGRFLGATSQPMAQWRRRPGDQLGSGWRISAHTARRAQRHVTYDANQWKSWVLSRLTCDPSQGLLLPGSDSLAQRMLADHLTSELPRRATHQGRSVDEWHLLPGRDNHWWDTLVMCAVAGSIQGMRTGVAVPRPQPISFAAWQRQVQEQRLRRTTPGP